MSTAARPWVTVASRSAPPPRARFGPGAIRAGVVMAAAAPIVLVAGWAAAGLSATVAVALAGVALGLLVLVPAIVARPEIGFLATLVLVAVVPIDTLFEYDLRFLAGGLKITDLLLALTLVSWLVAVVVDRRPVRLPSPAVTGLVLGFVGLGLLGLVTAWTQHAELKLSLLELRAILGLLLLFPAVDGIRRVEDLERAVAVFLGAVVVSAGVVTRDFILGRGTLTLFSADATRVNNLLYVYPLAGIVWSAALLPSIRTRAVRLCLLGVTGISGAALYFTSRRGGWLAALAGALVVLVMLPARRRGVLMRSLVLMGAAMVALVLLSNSVAERPIESPGASLVERLLSIDEGEDDPSTGHRAAELRRARELIADHPLTGIGPGSSFTFISPLYNELLETSDVPRTDIYVHNSYVWIALKLGLPALAAFVALLAVVLRQAYDGYRRSTDARARRLQLGALATLVALVLASFTEPHLTYVGSVPLFVAAVAVSQVAPRLAAAREPATAA